MTRYEREFGDATSRLRNMAGRGDLSGKLITTGLAAVTGLTMALGSFYVVGKTEQAVVTRNGTYLETTDAGLHGKMPFIDDVEKVVVTEVQRLELGFRTLEEGDDGAAKYETKADEATMLTGDENLVMVNWTVQYQVVDPRKWLYASPNPVGLLRDSAEAAMRQTVGDNSIDMVLTEGKSQVQEASKRTLQQIVDKYDMGVRIIGTPLQDVTPPAGDVSSAFSDVQSAKEDKEKIINEALAYANEKLPAARGLASQITEDAKGYAATRVNVVTGEANRFDKILEQYRRAPDVTRQRLYIETIEQVYPGLDKILIEGGKGVLPLLDLNKEGSQ